MRFQLPRTRTPHLNSEGITVASDDVGKLQVANNDVALAANVQAHVVKALNTELVCGSFGISSPCILTSSRQSNDGLVAANADLGVTADDALDDNDASGSVLLVDRRSELRQSRDSGHSAASTTLRAVFESAYESVVAFEEVLSSRTHLPSVSGGIA